MLPYTYSATYWDGTTTSKPLWLTFNNPSPDFSMTVTSPGDIGVYTVALTASTSQLNYVDTFTITVVSDCTLTSLTDRAFSNMQSYVSQTSDSQSLVFYDLIGSSHSDPNPPAYCGTRTYTLNPAYTFLTISYGPDILILFTANPADALGSPYTVDVTISLADYAWVPIPTLTKTF
jgi:hypothetical protein